MSKEKASGWAVIASNGKIISAHNDEVEAVQAKQHHWAASRHCRVVEVNPVDDTYEEQRKSELVGAIWQARAVLEQPEWKNCANTHCERKQECRDHAECGGTGKQAALRILREVLSGERDENG